MKKLWVFFIVMFSFITIAFASAVFWEESPVSSSTDTTICTMDAKLCPDGKTWVGRTGPNCEFDGCAIIKLQCQTCCLAITGAFTMWWRSTTCLDCIRLYNIS